MGQFSVQLGNAIAARTCRFSAPARAFVSNPEPKTIGSPERGMQVFAGNYLFGGEFVSAPDKSIWDIKAPSLAFSQALNGFEWLDDLVAYGTKGANQKAQEWLWQWLDIYGGGRGIGWTPQLTGRRVTRWVNHAVLLLQGRDSEDSKQFFRALGHQAKFLSKRWHAAPVGLARIEALVGLIYCGLSLETKSNLIAPAQRALAKACQASIAEDGSIASRNPEELMTIFSLLSWCAQSLSDAGYIPQRDHLLAIERIVPTLRALRLGDGGLGHFHGGGRGGEGVLDRALADAEVRLAAYPLGGMGYGRLAQSGTTVLVDTGAKPVSPIAHNSPLAFEISSGRFPLLVNAGPGHLYGAQSGKKAASLRAHNCVGVLDKEPDMRDEYMRPDAEDSPLVTHTENEEFQILIAKHTGYASETGLVHYRSLELSRDGRIFRGRDKLIADTAQDCTAFDNWMQRHAQHQMELRAYFHVAPDVEATVGMRGKAVTLVLPDGTVWVFQVKNAKLTLQPSEYVEDGRLKLRATKQIVVTFYATDYEGVISWTLTRG